MYVVEKKTKEIHPMFHLGFNLEACATFNTLEAISFHLKKKANACKQYRCYNNNSLIENFIPPSMPILATSLH